MKYLFLFLYLLMSALIAESSNKINTTADMDEDKQLQDQYNKKLSSSIKSINFYFKAHGFSKIVKAVPKMCKGYEAGSNYPEYCLKFEFNYDNKINNTDISKILDIQKTLAHCQINEFIKPFGGHWDLFLEATSDYLVNYAIRYKDESLMKSILFRDILHGNGCNASYTETITQNQYIPFYLHYPNIDKYLDQKEIDKATDRILDVMELYNETAGNQGLWAKYNSTFIFPDEGEEKEFKFENFIKIVDKQSPRLANDVKLSHMFSVLSINGLMDEDDINTTIEK